MEKSEEHNFLKENLIRLCKDLSLDFVVASLFLVFWICIECYFFVILEWFKDNQTLSFMVLTFKFTTIFTILLMIIRDASSFILGFRKKDIDTKDWRHS